MACDATEAPTPIVTAARARFVSAFAAALMDSGATRRDVTTNASTPDYRTRSHTYNTGAFLRFTTACTTTVKSLGDNSANARRTASFSSAPPS